MSESQRDYLVGREEFLRRQYKIALEHEHEAARIRKDLFEDLQQARRDVTTYDRQEAV